MMGFTGIVTTQVHALLYIKYMTREEYQACPPDAVPIATKKSTEVTEDSCLQLSQHNSDARLFGTPETLAKTKKNQ